MSAGNVRDGAEAPDNSTETVPCTLRELLAYFLWLGSFGFGGPIALAGYMQRDLVERRRWVSKSDYVEGLALAQLAPGPLAAQLAIYLGWVRAGNLGATLVAAAFILPSFVMVLVLSALYVRFGGIWWMQGLFYGIGSAVIAIIARSAYKLVGMTLGRDRPPVGDLRRQRPRHGVDRVGDHLAVRSRRRRRAGLRGPPRLGGRLTALMASPWMMTGLHGVASESTLWRIGWYSPKPEHSCSAAGSRSSPSYTAA
jgi:chromate transporter